MNRRKFLVVSIGRVLILLALLASLATVIGLAAAAENVDLQMVAKIRTEEFQNSKVMEIMSELCDRIGPRVTGSPAMKKANEWTRDQLTAWGMSNAHLESWDFGRGWSNDYISVRVVSPYTATLIAVASAWTPGTSGPVRGQAVRLKVQAEEDLQKYKGKLAAAVIMNSEPREVRPHETAEFRRYDDKDLEGIARFDIIPPARGGAGARARQQPLDPQQAQRQRQLQQAITKFLSEEKPLAIINQSGQGDGGTVFGTGTGPYRKDQPPATTPQLTLAVEHYQRITRLLDRDVPVELELDIRSQFYEGDGLAYNTIAEIPGTDKKDEVVMLGAHLDGWHYGTGATDNAAGSAVMMEALRILKTLGVRPRRTIRIGLWSGEEQGLLGSRAYVSQHFAERQQAPGGARQPGAAPGAQRAPGAPAAAAAAGAPGAPGEPFGPGGRGGQGGRAQGPLTTKPEYSKISAYFNFDNGTGKIRGVYLQGNYLVRPIFQAWIEPFQDLGVTTLTLRNTGGTDHQSFDGVNIPGFQFIQDPIEYNARTHHSNMDVLERIQKEDLMQAAAVIASFVYHVAMRDEMLPRKPLPQQPQPQQPAR
jgi:hypothetical protein